MGIIAAPPPPPPDFEVWPENWDALRLFFALGTQWTHAGMAGVRTGLKYEVVDWVAAKTGIDANPAVFEKLRILEAEALKVWAEKP